jgi:hypothetical protein
MNSDDDPWKLSERGLDSAAARGTGQRFTGNNKITIKRGLIPGKQSPHHAAGDGMHNICVAAQVWAQCFPGMS